MSEEELNEQYIKNKIQGICQDCMWFDKTIPIINKMLSEAYISGFEQGKFDLKMDLQQKVEQLENIRKEAIEYLKKRECDNYSCSVCSVMSDDLLNILNEGDNNGK